MVRVKIFAAAIAVAAVLLFAACDDRVKVKIKVALPDASSAVKTATTAAP